MRLATFRRHSDEPHVRQVGLVLGQGAHVRVHPFDAGFGMVELLAESAEWRDSQADVAAAGDGLALDEIVLLPPVYPVAMRDFLTFEAHVDGMERGHGNPGPPDAWYDAPVFLFMAPHAVTGPYDDVAMPPDTERLDFELEVAAIVCRDVRNVTPAEALDECRDGDGFLDLEMTVKVNDQQVGRDRSGHMGWSFEQLVSHASRASWVKAGEVLASGTCSTGSLAESWGRTGSLTPPPLQVGDVVEMTIERIGTIRNAVTEPEDNVAAVAPARRRPRLEASA